MNISTMASFWVMLLAFSGVFGTKTFPCKYFVFLRTKRVYKHEYFNNGFFWSYCWLFLVYLELYNKLLEFPSMSPIKPTCGNIV